MLETGFAELGYEFIHEPDFAPRTAEDEHWALAFRRFGGEIVVSADKNIAKRPHQIVAFKDNNLICFFCEKTWSQRDHTFKAAHRVYWWPRIHAHLGNCKSKDCWWVPMGIGPLEFREVKVPTHVLKTAKAQKSV
jgi:hypothetical protein